MNNSNWIDVTRAALSDLWTRFMVHDIPCCGSLTVAVLTMAVGEEDGQSGAGYWVHRRTRRSH